MTGCKGLWDAGRLAVVRGVGYPKPDRSHFRSMDIWQTGSPDRPVPTGWVGRWLDATGAGPAAAGLGRRHPAAAGRSGEKAAGVALPLTGFEPPAGALGAALAALSKPDPADPPAQALAARSARDPAGGDPGARPPRRGRGAEEHDGEAQRQGGSAGGQGALGRQLAAVPAASGPACRPGSTRSAWAASTPTPTRRAPSPGCSASWTRARDRVPAGLEADERGRRVVRRGLLRVRPAGARRTPATAPTTAPPDRVRRRPAVRGGYHGDQPSLTALDDGDLRVTTDFRSVYATLLERVLGTDAGRVLDGTRPALDFL